MEIDSRILLHTNPNRTTICYLSISVICVLAAFACFTWYSMEIDAKADTAKHEAAVAKHEAIIVKSEVKTVKAQSGHLYDVAADNKDRLTKLEAKK